jgi:hypothetical protein
MSVHPDWRTILDYVNGLKWPLISALALAYFKVPLTNLIDRITKAKASYGDKSIKIEGERKAAKIEAEAEIQKQIVKASALTGEGHLGVEAETTSEGVAQDNKPKLTINPFATSAEQSVSNAATLIRSLAQTLKYRGNRMTPYQAVVYSAQFLETAQ